MPNRIQKHVRGLKPCCTCEPGDVFKFRGTALNDSCEGRQRLPWWSWRWCNQSWSLWSAERAPPETGHLQTDTHIHTHLLKGQVFETIKAGFTITVLHKYSISLCWAQTDFVKHFVRIRVHHKQSSYRTATGTHNNQKKNARQLKDFMNVSKDAKQSFVSLDKMFSSFAVQLVCNLKIS